ncbi:MAG: hypothetical protein COA73_16050 [Candidatus Hydrogenedentota bacterium]|nr:MAG: hypothetical protein COA73_16050 [Candidatus Hydrogenedentota bacterium]
MLWLKAFDSVLIDSVFLAKDDTKNKRKFKFSGSIGIDGESCNVITDDIPRSTTVHLNGFKSDYRNRSPKTVDAIAKAICEHCLWYCIREGGLPNTTVKDRDESVSLESIYEKMMRSSTESDSAQIKGINLDLIHVRLRSVSSSHSIEFCANNRLVENKSISETGIKINLNEKSNNSIDNFQFNAFVRLLNKAG